MKEVCDGDITGTTGQSRRLGALRVRLATRPRTERIELRIHAAGRGWQDWTAEGATVGRTGEDRQLEALAIRLLP